MIAPGVGTIYSSATQVRLVGEKDELRSCHYIHILGTHVFKYIKCGITIEMKNANFLYI